MYNELDCLYDLCKCEADGRCDDHKGCQGCKNAAKEIRMKDALIISVKDKKLRSEFRKLKCADSTVAKYEEAGRLWDNDNATKL